MVAILELLARTVNPPAPLKPAPSIDFSDPYFLATLFFAFFNPLAWNVIGRLEHHTRFLTRICGGRKHLACYIFAVFIFTLGIVRDIVYKLAVGHQGSSATLAQVPMLDSLSYLSLAVGLTLVLSSMWKLGVTGTYLGDYFNILKSHRITSFPFDVAEHPMYYGSSLTFLSYALRMRSAAGLFLTSIIALAYGIAAKYEGAFTTKIYAKAASSRKKN